ncbi:type II secretion system F family protein [Mariprofundus ferrooxydans]|nr:type II secretion system F family protein [Mariprofundus ferrooxydans]MBN4077136.1 type II secretion system F family protein [Mariprofundus ferrooxydans]
MDYFHYAGKRDNGLSVRGWLMATDRDAAVAELRRRHVQPLQVRQGPGHIAMSVSVEQVFTSFRELASLRGSGMGLDLAVESVAKTAEVRKLKLAWQEVAQSIRSGLSLSDALASVPHVFPRYSVPMVRLGEANGELRAALVSVADRMEEELQLQNEVKSALTYPAFLIVISVAVLLFLFLVVIPKFGSMVGDMGGGASSSILVLIAIAEFMQNYFWLWGSISVAVVLGLIHLHQAGVLQEKIWHLAMSVPGVKGLIDAWEIVQFSSSMRRLLTQGVGILESLQLTAETLSRPDVSKKLILAAGAMRRGESLAKSMADQQLFTPLVLQMIAVGETAASLPDSLQEVGKLYERRLREGIRRALSLLEPAVIVTLGIMVGGIMVSLLSGIMSMNDLPI